MLTIYSGGFFSQIKERVREDIQREIDKKRRVFLIVPEQQTVDCEEEMAELLPSDAPIFLEVTNFTRFANTVFRSVGGLAGEAADETRRALMMWRALRRLASDKSPKDINHARVLRALSAVKEMQSLGITAGELDGAVRTLSERGEDTGLPERVTELARTMTLYREALSEKFKGREDDLELLAGKLSEIDGSFFSDTTVFIDGFTSFTEPQYRVIDSLLTLSDIRISLSMPSGDGDAFEYSELYDARRRLTDIAKRRSVDTSLKKCDALSPFAQPLIADACRSIWRINAKIDNDYLQNTEALRVFEASTPYDECDFIASDIKKRVMAGASYSDFGILSRDISSYLGILDTAFEKLGIPVFISRGSDISEYEAIKLIYTALSAIISDFDARDVITYAKCSLSGVPRDMVDEFELYCSTWKINRKRFTDGEPFNMNPDGYTAQRRDGADEKLLRINQTRESIIRPLCALGEAVHQAKSVIDFSRCLYDFLAGLGVEEALALATDAIAATKDSEGARSISRLWQVICSALDALTDAVGEEEVDLPSYLNLLKIVFSSSVISRIPSTKDEVSAGSADVSRMHGKQHIYLIGANFGAFPASVSDGSLFSDRDKRALCSVGLNIEPDRQIRSARELFYFSRAMSYAEKTLTVSYSAKNTAFSKILPSLAIERLRDISGGYIKPRLISEIPLIDRIYSPEQAAEHSYTEKEYEIVKAALLSVKREGIIELYEAPSEASLEKLDTTSVDLLYKNGLALTQSRIDVYVGCPTNYFCKFNLGLKDNPKAELGANGIGSFIHAILESFFKTLKERGRRISELGDDEKSALAKYAAEKYISDVFDFKGGMSARMRVNVDRLIRASRPVIDNLCREFSSCGFEPVFFELDISKRKPENPSPAVFKTSDGKEVYVYGIIDRVDTYATDDKLFVRVVDYKTGSKSFSPEDFKEGRNLQMFLYLKSIIESDNPKFKERLGASEREVIPAGIIYVKTDVSGGSIKKSNETDARECVDTKQKRIGMILDDEEVISATGLDFLPCARDKAGNPKKDKKSFFTEEDFKKYNETVGEVIRDISDGILGGNIAPTPSADACKYCDFRAFCRRGAEKKRF